MGVWGCPLTPGPTEGSIGAAHGPREKICRGMGVFFDPRTNPGKYGAAPPPGRKSVGVRGCPLPLPLGPSQGGIGAAHRSQEQFCGSSGVFRSPSNNSWRYWGVPPTPEITRRAY